MTAARATSTPFTVQYWQPLAVTAQIVHAFLAAEGATLRYVHADKAAAEKDLAKINHLF